MYIATPYFNFRNVCGTVQVPLPCAPLEQNLSNNSIVRYSGTSPRTSFSTEEARQIAWAIGIDFNKELFDVEQFRIGLEVELEHGKIDPVTNVTNDDPILTGKIALAHLKEFPDYYVRLTKMEEEAKAYWSAARCSFRETKEFTISELAQYDGAMGRPAYVAVNGIVYDVSNEATWGGASHFGLISGRDLSTQFQSCHNREAILEKLPKVGILKL
jgi:predicted heme/steroid binding protein